MISLSDEQYKAYNKYINNLSTENQKLSSQNEELLHFKERIEKNCIYVVIQFTKKCFNKGIKIILWCSKKIKSFLLRNNQNDEKEPLQLEHESLEKYNYSNNDINRLAFFLHYNKDETFSEEDYDLLVSIKKLCNTVIFITNSFIPETQIQKITPLVNKILFRLNIGYDFGGWKDGFIDFGFENLKNFDQCILINNSVYPPLYDLNIVFNKMTESKCDFWGITYNDSNGKYEPYLNDYCYSHIQSYFICFNNNVFTSEVFINWWKNINYTNGFIDTIRNCETKLTKYLTEAGFTCNSYSKEYDLLSKYYNSDILFSKPELCMENNFVFLKKKVISLEDYRKNIIE